VKYDVKAEVDGKLSVDPSYIIRCQIFRDGQFIGDGVVQYHREAEENDIPLTVLAGKEKLDEEDKRHIRHQIVSAAFDYMDKKGFGISS